METVFSKKQITANLYTTALKINNYYETTIHRPLLTVPILNGGIFFYVDLVRELGQLKLPTEMGIISTNHYGEAEVPFENVKLRYIDCNVENRDVLLFDEICFTGKTLKFVKEYLLKQGAKSVKSVVLVNHIRENRVYAPDFSVLNFTGEAWLVGYGMDLEGRYRELEEIIK